MVTPFQSRKRILTLDGGGIRGLFSIEVLARIEELLREHCGNPKLVLADHFQMIARTSTGAIIGTFLSCGGEVAAKHRSAVQGKSFFRLVWMF